MKAVGLTRYLPIDHPESLMDIELPIPRASGQDLLVRVHAIAVNPVDTKVRKPKDKVESAPKILGWDAAGEVVEVGLDCTLFKTGDKVFYAGDITRAGSNAEYQLVDERIVGHLPQSLNYEQAVALPLTAITADIIAQHQILNRIAKLVDQGMLTSKLHKTLSPINAANLRKAHAQLETGSTIGKIVLSGWH